MTLRIRDSKTNATQQNKIDKYSKNVQKDFRLLPKHNKKAISDLKYFYHQVTTGVRYVTSFTDLSDVTYVTTQLPKTSAPRRFITDSFGSTLLPDPIDLTKTSTKVNNFSNSPANSFDISFSKKNSHPHFNLPQGLHCKNNRETATSFRGISESFNIHNVERTLVDQFSKAMISSRRHHSDETFSDREHLAAVGRKSNYPKSAETWPDSRSSPDHDISNDFTDVGDDAKESVYNTSDSLCENPEGEVKKDENFSENEENSIVDDPQDSPFNYSVNNRNQVNETAGFSKPELKLIKAKKARVENIVTNIKDKPVRSLAGDGQLDYSQVNCDRVENRHSRKRRMDEKIQELKREIETLRREYHSEEHGCKETTENYNVEREDLEEEWNQQKKRPRMDNDHENSQSGDLSPQRNYNGFYSGSINFMIPQNGRRHLAANEIFTQNMAYQILVQSIKRELATALEKVAEKSARRILDELRNGTNSKHEVATQSSLRNEENEETDREEIDAISKSLENENVIELVAPKELRCDVNCSDNDGKTEHVRTSNRSQMCFGDVQVRKNFFSNKESDPREPKFTTSGYACPRKIHSGWNEDTSRSRQNQSSPDESDVQTQALSLVKKKSFAVRREEKSSSPTSTRPFVIRDEKDQYPTQATTPDHDPTESTKFSRPSVSSEQSVRSSRSPSDVSSQNKFLHHSLLSESGNFYSSSSSAFRLPLQNEALHSPSFRRDTFPTSNLLKTAPFSFGPSMYHSTTGHSPSVFPFSTGQLPFPIFQNFHQRSLANVIADYGRIREGFDYGPSRPVSTRTSTREPPRTSGIARSHHSHKPDGLDFRDASSEISPYSTASDYIQEGLTPQHLKKAKLMFFYTRYPSANTLKTYFGDVKFSRATTSQLIKWFSNFREFYYIQMEKFARQALSEGKMDIKQLQVTRDSELFRVLNLHYNKSNDFRVPNEFLVATLRSLQEFFLAIQKGKDRDPSWKKVIYKIICKLDQDIPELFKLPNVLDRLDEISI